MPNFWTNNQRLLKWTPEQYTIWSQIRACVPLTPTSFPHPSATSLEDAFLLGSQLRPEASLVQRCEEQ